MLIQAIWSTLDSLVRLILYCIPLFKEFLQIQIQNINDNFEHYYWYAYPGYKYHAVTFDLAN